MDKYTKEQVIKAIQFFRNNDLASGLFNYKILKANNQVATSEDLYELFTQAVYSANSILAAICHAELKPLSGKYYGTYVELFDKENNSLGEVKFWLPPISYTKENISPRERKQAVEDWGEDEWYMDWDWTHSENLLTYQMAILFVNAVNN